MENVEVSDVIRPKLSREELEKYRKSLDRRRGMLKASEATGLSRGTIRNVAMAGCGNDRTIAKIREYININDDDQN